MDFTVISGYISIGVTVLSVLLAIVNFILTTIKKKAISAENEKLKSDITSVEGTIKLISEVIPSAVVFAEQSNMSGEMKELVAKAQILVNCSKEGITYDDNQVQQLITDIIALTKKVNC